MTGDQNVSHSLTFEQMPGQSLDCYVKYEQFEQWAFNMQLIILIYIKCILIHVQCVVLLTLLTLTYCQCPHCVIFKDRKTMLHVHHINIYVTRNIFHLNT